MLYRWCVFEDVPRCDSHSVGRDGEGEGGGGRCGNLGNVSYVHQTGDIVIPIDRMKEFFEDECDHGQSFEDLPIEEWARRVEAAGMRSAVTAVFANIPRLPRALCFPRFVKTWRPRPGEEGRDGGMLLVRHFSGCCGCGEVSPVRGEGCPGCGKIPVMPASWVLEGGDRMRN